MVKDFEILLVDGELVLKGHLTDATLVSCFREQLSQGGRVNMSQLYSVSWAGLQHIYDIMMDSPATFLLCKVPSNIYRMFLMFPFLGQNIQIESFDVTVLNENPETMAKQKTQPVQMLMETLADLGMEKGCFVTLPDGRKVLGSLHHLCRPHFGSESFPEPNFVNSWAKDNKKQCMFWYNYICYVRTILETCLLAQISMGRLIEESLQGITNRIVAAEASVKVLVPTFSHTRGRMLLSLLPPVYEVSQATMLKTKHSCVPYDELAWGMEALFLSEKGDSEDFRKSLETVSICGTNLQEITKSLEEVGVALGDKIFTYGDVSELRTAFSSIPKELITEKIIHSVRRKFKFESQEGTWEHTVEEILRDFDDLQKDLDRCVIAMQGFDLVRQVLEHRIHEATVLAEELPSFQANLSDWGQAQDKVTETAQKKLVTDQERFSFQFYFPSVSLGSKDGELSPGEAMFF